MIGWHSDTEDGANFFEFLTFTKDAKTGMGQYNCGGYANAEADKMVMEANTETDPGQACRHPAEGGSHADRQTLPYLPLHWEDLAYGAKKNVDIKPW